MFQKYHHSVSFVFRIYYDVFSWACFPIDQLLMQATISKRLLLLLLHRMRGSDALCIFLFYLLFFLFFFLNLILHSGFIDAVHIWTVSASFCRTFSRTMCSRCSFWQTIEAACRLGIVSLGAQQFRLLIIHAIQIPIHFGLLCDMREELSDTKWQDCDPQSWSLWYDS
jgi:hypothetical protein